MPSDPDQDRDEAQGMDAEEAHYWERRNDPYEDWCSECDKFGEECRCDPEGMQEEEEE
jgi:hypothetical protein